MTNKEKLIRGLEALEREGKAEDVTINIKGMDDIKVSVYSYKTYEFVPIALDEFMEIDTLNINEKALLHSLSTNIKELTQCGTSANTIIGVVSALTA